MWISKKKWNEMCDDLANVKRVLRYLTDCHEEVKIINFKGEQFETNFAVGYKHNIEITADTDKVKDITLQELAKLVIDGEPIKRTEKIDMTTEFHGRV